MNLPGRKLTGSIGISLTLIAGVVAVAAFAGAPFAGSASYIGGVHAEFGNVTGSNFTLKATMGGPSKCKVLLSTGIQNATIRGLRIQKQISLPVTGISFSLNLTNKTAVRAEDVWFKFSSLEGFGPVDGDRGQIFENYTTTSRMDLGQSRVFTLNLDHVNIQNAEARMFAISAASIDIPLKVPEIGLNMGSQNGGMESMKCGISNPNTSPPA
ncbi:MAG: hypothetical protein SV760_08150 [Halobacteria archaeon]|nr:hypothetical protein [Halobacteria archaeon]